MDVVDQIREVRGLRVLLDFDLAALYGVTTKRLNEAVGRNLARFPPDFAFRLTPEEVANLRSQFATSRWGGTRYAPRAFTEQVSPSALGCWTAPTRSPYMMTSSGRSSRCDAFTAKPRNL